jgi:hypothetical protein
LLPVLPVLLKGSHILNNDMLVAYFCYFWDFHKNWSWVHPLVFWSSSYQCGMPMHAYWQSGYLYPVTWVLFGPLSPHIGIHLFYAFHFALGIYGFLKLGPRLGLHGSASLWAGICFSLSGTMLARYEHATFMAGWAWMPLVLHAFLALRDGPGPKRLFPYAAAVTLQALGGHPQASVTTAILIGAFTVPVVTRALRRGPPAGKEPAPGIPGGGHPGRRAWIWILGGHALALCYCAPMLVPFVDLVGRTDRFDGTAWEGGKAGEAATPEQAAAAARADAGEKLEQGVFGFEKFATGGMRPLHLLSLAAPHALGSPSNASWWGGEAWGEVFVYCGGLGLFFCFFASPRRANRDARWLWALGLVGLWLAFGKHLGASQILYHVPVLNNFRRPARFLILFAFGLAALSGHGFQRWLGRPSGRKPLGVFAIAALGLAAGLGALRLAPGGIQALLHAAENLKRLDPSKDYGQKMTALLGRGAMDAAFLALSAAAAWWCARTRSVPQRHAGRVYRLAPALLFAVLLADLLRVHWDHFYLFPRDFYRSPPESARVLDASTRPFWRVSHYLEYPGLEMWQMHNDPVAHFALLEREKTALSCGIHAIFGYRHVSAHLPLMWQWDPSTSPAGKSARYLFSNREMDAYRGDSLRLLGRFGSVNAYELKDWRPRIETRPAASAAAQDSLASTAGPSPVCPSGYSGFGGLCVNEPRDGTILIQGNWRSGDTVLVRERYDGEWRFREAAGIWQKPRETPDHFLALPLGKKTTRIDLEYYPTRFYELVGLCLGLTVVLAALFGLFCRRRSLRT